MVTAHPVSQLWTLLVRPVWWKSASLPHSFCMPAATHISLAEAATSVILVMTNTCLLWQTCVCRDKTPFAATKVCLSQQTYFCCDKNFVMTNICREKHDFVATKVCLSWQSFCCDKNILDKCFVVASILLLQQKMRFVTTNTCLSRQNLCHDKTVANDTHKLLQVRQYARKLQQQHSVHLPSWKGHSSSAGKLVERRALLCRANQENQHTAQFKWTPLHFILAKSPVGLLHIWEKTERRSLTNMYINGCQYLPFGYKMAVRTVLP